MAHTTSILQVLARPVGPAPRWRTVVSNAALPPELSAIIETTVRSARLWPSERFDLAHELVAHFRDGLDAGGTPNGLTSAFGDPKSAAKLITRARRRSRPAWYHAFIWVRRGLSTVLVLTLTIYAYLAGRYYLGQPQITRNFAAEFNHIALAGPTKERAWPLYLDALRALGKFPAFEQKDDFPTSPASPNWHAALDYLRTHANAIATIREAAAKPTLGVPYRSTTDPDLMKALQSRQPFTYTPEPEDENPMLVGVLLPHLGELRRFARLLRFDAREALTVGDSRRFVADVDAILGMSTQAWSEPFIISDLVSLAMLSLACDLVCEALANTAFTSGELTHLAHRLAAAPALTLQFDFDAERASYDDFAQRFFSDDGRGDGHTVYAGLPATYQRWGTPEPGGRLFMRTALPALTVVHVTRAEFSRLTAEAAAAAQHDQSLPLWRRFERTCDVSRRKLDAAMGDIFPPMRSLMSDNGIGGMIISRDRTAQRREATLTALAVESFHIARGRYPATLAELVPSFLPRIPIDAADGRPLRYTLVDDRPLIYSAGCDGDDDGGRPPAKGNFMAEKFGPSIADPDLNKPETNPQEMDEYDGDWVLYPIGHP